LLNEVLGRPAELAAIQTLLSRSRTRLAALLFEGEPGIGKSTLWRWTVANATEAGVRVLQSRPTAAEEALTFGGLVDIFAEVPSQAMLRLPDPQRHALEVALLRVEPRGRSADQRAVSIAAAGLLAALSEAEAPLLLAIDDVQWLDAASAAVLTFAIRRLQNRPIGVLLCLRGSAAAGAPLGIDTAVPADRLERVPLGPMSVAGLHQLLRARLGRSFGRLELVRIQEVSAGNPFFALEIARAVIRSGAAITPGERLPVPSSLAALTRQRITALPNPTREALLVAAACVEPTLDTLRRVITGDPTVVLAPAVDEGIVVLEDDRVKFTHPLLSETVLESAGRQALRGVHSKLASTASSEDARAWHMGQAANRADEEVAAALEQAAERARSRGAAVYASSLYQQSCDVTPSDAPERAVRRAVLAAECLFIDISEEMLADQILIRAIRKVSAGPTRAIALSLRALVLYYHGRIEEAIQLVERATSEVGDDPVTRAIVLLRRSFLFAQVDIDRGAAAAIEALALLEPIANTVDPDLLANALLMVASTDFALVHGPDPWVVERGLRLITRDGRSLERDYAAGLAFGLARHQDNLDRAIEITKREIQEKSGPGGDDPFTLVQLAGLICMRGDWNEARLLAESALDAYSREGAETFREWALRGVAMVAAHQGRVDDAQRFASEGLLFATRSGNLVVAVMHLQILGFTALSLGDFSQADHLLTEAATTAQRTGIRHPGRFKLDGDRVEAALAVGAIDSAQAIVEQLEEAGRNSPTPWVLAIGARCRGQLDAARGNLDSAVEAVRRSIVEHETLQMPFERAHTLLVLGQLLRRRNERREARSTLMDALAVFERLGAPLWAERVRTELARMPVRRAHKDLTPTEENVARLASAGLTNKEVAERAFMSPKTVEANLARVYDKLGIHSRAELGRAMLERETSVKT
jgi:DNA-binding CsgD family transcriptional regulator